MRHKYFLLILLMLLPLVAGADVVEIDGIYYTLVSKTGEATVTSNPNYYKNNVIIPKSINYEGLSYDVTSIGSYAFSDCVELNSIIIPNGLTSIGFRAFGGCRNLTSITIPNSVKIIEGSAFADCKGLFSITIPESVMSIGDYVLENCSELAKVILPPNIKYIGIESFKNCTNLESIIIPDNVEKIGYHAFDGCSKLTSITIPPSVKAIDGNAFRGCGQLKIVNIFDISAWCNIDFANYQYSNPLTYAGAHLYKEGKEIIHLVIPKGVSQIKAHAFTNCGGLLSVIVDNDVVSIGDYAFMECCDLKSVNIGNSVTSICYSTFSNCSSLTTVKMGLNMNIIGSRSFENCSELLDVYCYAQNVPQIKEYYGYGADFVFKNSYINGTTLHVPAALVNDYKTAEPWNSFKEIKEIMPEYTITFIVNGEEYKKYKVEEGEKLNSEPFPIMEGYTFSGWSDIPETMPGHDVIVTGAFSVNKYILTYTVDGKEYKSYQVEYGATIIPEVLPQKEGYIFSGWSEIPETMPGHDVTIYGSYTNTSVVTLDFTLADADNTKVSLWGFPASSANKTVEEKSFTYGGYTVKVAGSEEQGYYWHDRDHWLLFGKQGATLTLPAFDFDVERIDIEGNPSASSRVLQNIYVGETAVSTETEGAQGTNIFYIAADYQAAGNVYVIKVTSSHNNMIKTIKIWKKGTSGEIIPPEEPEEPVATTEEVLKVENVTANKEQTVSVDICLDNKKTDLTAYQFDLTLPAGITLAKNDKGKLLVSKTDRYEDDNQSLTVSNTEGNTWRFVCFSLSNGIIEGTAGAILNAVLAIDGNVADGTYEAQIANIIFTQADGKQLKLADAKFNIVVNSIVEGDANGDGEINVSDIVEIVNYIMDKPSAGFVFLAADLNGDGEVNVTDIVMVVNIIMAGNSSSARSMEGKADGLTDNDYLKLIGNEDGRMSLCLDNQGSYVASQFDLRLSDGQELKGITLNGNRMAGHYVNYTQMGEGLYKVIVYSLSNEAYKGQAGELLSFDISGAGTVSVENILFVTAGQAEKRFASLQSMTTGIMTMKTLPSEKGQWYDLQGRRVADSAKKGVYINKGKKLVVR